MRYIFYTLAFALSLCIFFGCEPQDSDNQTTTTTTTINNGCGPEVCADEVLAWQYDETTQKATINNKNVWLNCCGEHSISALFNEETGVYEIRETDAPEEPGGRCFCMCFFDFTVELTDISSSVISVIITRDTTDDEMPRGTVWEGSLDLSAGSGEVIIAEDVGWCDDGSSLNLGETAVLPYQETLYNEEENISITFESVIGDSRCPADAQCVWEGDAEIGLVFSKADQTSDITLHTHPDYTTSVSVSGYTITLTDLEPPASLKDPPVPEDYAAHIVITKFP